MIERELRLHACIAKEACLDGLCKGGQELGAYDAPMLMMLQLACTALFDFLVFS